MEEQTKTAAAGIALILCGFMIAALSVLSAHNRKLEEERMNDKRAAVIDSLKRENENLRSKATELKEQVNRKEIEVDSLKSKKSDFIVRYKTLRDESTDTLFVYIADSLNEVNNEIIDTLEHGLNTCQHVIKLQDEQIKNDSLAMVEYTDIIKYQTATIAKLERTWWDRNKLWVGLIGGTIVGSLGTWAVMK
ncbi:MAG: hypothetical protein IJP79_07360 [Paludibacteraceae bacterium]|nr:hypothetical protein [Paludibacteraceae bacterium]MBQ6963502.1 hypothetical protein [Paludibacteraceae bacterium]MBQ7662484.1 hypothetical protein [Prevotella sp.]MBQ7748292.1 hypothetical protein [Paludibacteraceae bacterium]